MAESLIREVENDNETLIESNIYTGEQSDQLQKSKSKMEMR